MSRIIIKDLEVNEELDAKALAKVKGGAGIKTGGVNLGSMRGGAGGMGGRGTSWGGHMDSSGGAGVAGGNFAASSSAAAAARGGAGVGGGWFIGGGHGGNAAAAASSAAAAAHMSGDFSGGSATSFGAMGGAGGAGGSGGTITGGSDNYSTSVSVPISIK